MWGLHPVWSFCRCLKAVRPDRKKTPAVVGSSPFDESVHGIRDLAGSVDEYTTDRTSTRYRYISRRGGNWDTSDDYCFRAANRNGYLPWGSGRGTGFRLVAVPKAPPKG